MKLSIRLVLFAIFLAVPMSQAIGQNTNSAAQAAADLRAQLQEVQVKEAELKARAQQLDEELKPENIEHSLAGVGSTHPEDLREQRRRQLSSERASVMRQLELLAARRGRLESALQTAETQAYQQSAEGTTTPLNRFGMVSYVSSSRLLIAVLLGCLAMAGIVGLSVLMRRQ